MSCNQATRRLVLLYTFLNNKGQGRNKKHSARPKATHAYEVQGKRARGRRAGVGGRRVTPKWQEHAFSMVPHKAMPAANLDAHNTMQSGIVYIGFAYCIYIRILRNKHKTQRVPPHTA